MTLVLDYDGTPQGYTFHLGDSVTNNGGGGDSGTQTRDAELEIVWTSSMGTQLNVFGSDLATNGVSAARLFSSFLRLSDSSLKLTLSDMFVGWGSACANLDFTSCPDGADLIYALGGQPDAEGPVNYDLFVGMNRVVGPSFPPRIGSGLALVYIQLE